MVEFTEFSDARVPTLLRGIYKILESGNPNALVDVQILLESYDSTESFEDIRKTFDQFYDDSFTHA